MTSYTKILFLDVDGVLNGHDFHEGAQSNTIRRNCIDQLSAILKATNCHVVLSSAWRYMILGNAMKLGGFEYLLRTHGCVGIAGKLHGITCADEDCAHCGAKHRRNLGIYRRVNAKRRSARRFDERGYFVCPDCCKPSSRGDQISRWLRDYGPVDRYVVVDDEDYEVTDCGHPLVKTDGACGLTAKDAKKAIRILNGG